jgi:hypothetical protein
VTFAVVRIFIAYPKADYYGKENRYSREISDLDRSGQAISPFRYADPDGKRIGTQSTQIRKNSDSTY